MHQRRDSNHIYDEYIISRESIILCTAREKTYDHDCPRVERFHHRSQRGRGRECYDTDGGYERSPRGWAGSGGHTEWPVRVLRQLPVVISQRRIVLSSLAERSVPEVSVKQTAWTALGMEMNRGWIPGVATHLSEHELLADIKHFDETLFRACSHQHSIITKDTLI